MGPSLILVIILGISELAYGAQRVDIKERVKENLNRNFLRSGRRHARSVETTADHLLSLNRDETLTPTDSVKTADNKIKVKYTEQYKGLPVIGEAVVLELTSDGQFTDDTSGTILEHIEDDVPSIEPVLSKEEAFAIVVTKSGRKMEDISFRPEKDIRLVIYTDHDADNTDETRNIDAYLAYEVTITIMDPTWPKEYQYTIDANTGDVLEKNSLVETSEIHINKHHKRAMEIEAMGGNEKIGAFTYGVDRERLQVYTKDGTTCRLENDNAVVVHLNNSRRYDLILENTTGFEFDCKEGYSDEVNGAYSPLSDAYYYFNKVHDMYQEWYGFKPLKRRAFLAVHVWKDLDNAGFMPSRNLLFIGDGDNNRYPLTSMGIIAHEVSHGFTTDHSQLEYLGESGAINEAFSDMASEAAKFYLNGKSDWMYGSEVVKNEQGIFRFMDNPPQDNRSVASYQDYCPGIEVHQSSGIFNKAFYLLANRPGWDVRKAFHVFVNANKLYWSKYTDFAEGACGAVKAAKDLGYSTEDVKAVFRDVDVEPCEKRRFNFQNLVQRPLKRQRRFDKYYDLKSDAEKVDIIILETLRSARRKKNKTNYILKVTHNGRIIKELAGQRPAIVSLKNLKPGRYYITIEGHMGLMSVYVLYDHFFQARVTARKSAEEGSFFGYATVNVTTANSRDGLIIRSTGDGDYYGEHRMYTRFGMEVDYQNDVHDKKGYNSYRGGIEVLYCATNTGKYNVLIQIHKPRNFTVDAYRVFNLFPRMELM